MAHRADVSRICVVAGVLGVGTLLTQAGASSGQGVPVAAAVTFRNVAVAARLDFVLNNSPTAEKHLPETMAGGVAAFDYDGDGLTDIYFANGAALPGLTKDNPKYSNRLYRNLGGMRFADVTERAHVA